MATLVPIPSGRGRWRITLHARQYSDLQWSQTMIGELFTSRSRRLEQNWCSPAQLSFTIAAGHHVDIDTARRSAWADDDPTQSVVANIDWYASRWSALAPNPLYFMTFRGSTTTGITQALATWHDRYIT